MPCPETGFGCTYIPLREEVGQNGENLIRRSERQRNEREGGGGDEGPPIFGGSRAFNEISRPLTVAATAGD